MAAASGTATSKPTNPNRYPNANSANISQTGCKPVLSPTSFGVNTYPSSTWPSRNVPETTSIQVKSGQNCANPTASVSSNPDIEPTYGMNESRPDISPIKKPKCNPVSVNPTA